MIFVCVQAGVRDFTWRARDLELCLANKRATSLPGDDETEYSSSL